MIEGRCGVIYCNWSVVLSTEAVGLVNAGLVELLQDQVHVLISQYMRIHYNLQPTRFGKLLLLMPCLKMVPGHVISQLFFQDSIGTIQVEKLLCDIFQSTIIKG